MSTIGFRLVAALALAAAGLIAAAPARAAEPQKHRAGHSAKHHAKHPAKKHGKPKASNAAASAAKPVAQQLGEAGAWTAYAAGDGGGRVCYVVAKPEKSEPRHSGRKPPMAMVTHRPAENVANVVSFVEGSPLKEGSEVALAVGKAKFELFTKDDSAWARTADLDRSIVAALTKGDKAVVKAQPQKGSATTDIYSLAGFQKALALIDKACGVKR